MTAREAALALLLHHPAQVGRWCGFASLTDELHGAWMEQMLTTKEDCTVLAHRGSYKTTCLTLVMAMMLCIYPERNLLFLRKTDADVAEVLRQVASVLQSDAMKTLSAKLYGAPVLPMRATASELTTTCYHSPRGAVQLLGQGIGGSLTGKHADVVFTDDIVNLSDRLSGSERRHTRAIYQELQNIRNPGGVILNTGTPWHREDAIALMPNVHRYDCTQTGLLTKEQLRRLRQSMSPSLFAANYELRHIAEEEALFATLPPFAEEEILLRDGIAHVDAAYGGGDYTALTVGKRVGDTLFLYGRLWHADVNRVLPAIEETCNRLLVSPVYCEINGDKGYLAQEMRRQGMLVRTYTEHMPKHIKIATYLRKWWPNLRFLRATDPAYIRQIMDYTEEAEHDDAPDSAACLARLLDRRG